MASPKFFDCIMETTESTGTGALTPTGASQDNFTFASVLSEGDTFYYGLHFPDENQREVGLGTWTGGTIVRTTIIKSTSGASALNLGSGTKYVWIDDPALMPGRVFVSTADTTPSTLFAKLSEGTGISLAIANAGANETVAISATGSAAATTVTVADTTDSTCWVGLFESATGDLAPKTDGSLTYNASTGALSATTYTSTVSTGTSPLTVSSTTKVSNLNADLLDDQTGSYYLDSANFTGTNWTDLTDGGGTTLHVHAASTITGGAALTKADDTNVTLTLGGSPTTALLAAASITAGWTGTLAASRGGTGVGTLGDITRVNDTNVTLTLGGTPTGAVITSTSFTLGWSGTLAASRGGTGVGTLGDITRVNDTNVTLTLGGTPTGAVITSTSFTLGWTGTLAVARGGTGVGTLGDITRVNDTNVTLTLGGTPTGAVITSTSFTLGWSGQLAASRGGTGVSALGDITRVDDTNVTLTLGGTPTGAVITSTSFTMGWTGQLAISRGGTGQSTATAAFDALSPTTTRGDLIARGASNNVRLAIGANTRLLGSDGTDPSWVAQSFIDHGSIGGLSDDDHTQYALLAGRSGGQTLIGGTASGNDLTLSSTSNSTKGSIVNSHSVKHALTTSTSTSLTLDKSNHVVLMNNSSASTVTLPAASGNSGLVYYIKKIHSSTSATVTIDGNASETIDGATTCVLYCQYDAVRIDCDGSNWHIINDERQVHTAKMTRAATQTPIGSNMEVKINFDQVDFDNAGIADATTNDRFNIKRAGKYLISCSWQTGNKMDDNRLANCRVYKNGVITEVGGQQYSPGASRNLTPMYVTTMSLAASDYIEFYVKHDQPPTTTVSTQTGFQAPSMSIVEIR